MSAFRNKPELNGISCRTLSAVLMIALALVPVYSLYAKGKNDKDKKAQEEQSNPTFTDNRGIWEKLDLSKFVWPNPPAITRIRYKAYWSGEKFVEKKQEKKKSSWMQRLSGVAIGSTSGDLKPRWQLVNPNGIAVDSNNLVYIADSKVRAIFIVNVDTGEYSMIKNGSDASFKWPLGLAIDDTDRLFVADSGTKRVLVFNKNHKVEGSISEGLYAPGSLAVDNDNRLLYVTDAEQDLVFVYNADPPYNLIRKLGKPGTKHTATAPGQFAKPVGVAVDKEGDVYISDTWNTRIQVFDADGMFIRTFGEAGDGPGYFARPKGLSIDGDGHVWVADSVQNRVQVFTPEGRLLIWMGGAGMLPGQFQSLANVIVDKNNRVLTTEMYGGRLQVFQYYSNSEARAELERRRAEEKKKTGQKKPASPPAPAPEAKK